MKYIWSFALPFLLLTTVPAQSNAPEKIGLANGLQRSYNTLKVDLKEAVEQMPEPDYGFKPEPKAWTFGRLMAHIANFQFSSCADAKGEADPNQGNNNNEKKATKAEIIKALDDSFSYCDQVFASLTNETAMDFVTHGSDQVSRGVVLANTVSHSNQIYGIGVVYMSFKGVSIGPMHRMELLP